MNAITLSTAANLLSQTVGKVLSCTLTTAKQESWLVHELHALDEFNCEEVKSCRCFITIATYTAHT